MIEGKPIEVILGGFVVLHDVDVPSRREPKEIRVRASSIDAIIPRRDYTTLFVGGKYVHVQESADAIQAVIR